MLYIMVRKRVKVSQYTSVIITVLACSDYYYIFLLLFNTKNVADSCVLIRQTN